MASVYNLEGMQEFLAGKAVEPTEGAAIDLTLGSSETGVRFWREIDAARQYVGSVALLSSEGLLTPANEIHTKAFIRQKATPLVITSTSEEASVAARLVFDNPTESQPEFARYGWFVEALVDVGHARVLENRVNARFTPQGLTLYTLRGAKPFTYDLTGKAHLPELAEDTVNAYAKYIRMLVEQYEQGTSAAAA